MAFFKPFPDKPLVRISGAPVADLEEQGVNAVLGSLFSRFYEDTNIPVRIPRNVNDIFVRRLCFVLCYIGTLKGS
jgi:hypothetical protein